MPYTDFHYTPTGTGVISGKEVLEQTEDAINDLGGQISGDVQTAIDTANNALNTANTASADAQNAVNTANTAYTAATNAQNTANAAQNTASNALTAAQNAQNDVNALGNRVTTAENNISQNTSDISGLTTRMGTAEGNITNLQNDVITAQGTATSAQNTATMARQQAYVLRYSSTAITDNSTIAYSTLDNTDNIKADDKIIDVDGKIFSIVSVDSDNSTVTVGTALVDLALDANVVHTSGNETVGGKKIFSDDLTIYNYDSSQATKNLNISSSKIQVGDTSNSDSFGIRFNAGASYVAQILAAKDTTGTQNLQLSLRTKDGSDNFITSMVRSRLSANGNSSFEPGANDSISLGSSVFKWKDVYATNYYYGANNVEFSTKFVTTDTAQNITATKSFTATQYIYNADTNTSIPNLYLRNQISEKGNIANPNSQFIVFTDKNNKRLSQIQTNKGSLGETSLSLRIETTDNSNNDINSQINYYITKLGTKNFTANADNEVNLGTSGNKWKDVQTRLINGLTPSSLGMPSDRSARVDISGYFTNTASGDTNTYTVPVNGWIYLNLNDVVVAHCFAQIAGNLSHYGQTFARASAGQLHCLFPVRKDDVFVSQWYTTTTVTVTNAYFIPCQGNI